MQSEGLVGYDEDGVDGSPAEGVHERVQVPVDLGLRSLVDGEGRNFLAEPLPYLVVPVLKIEIGKEKKVL